MVRALTVSEQQDLRPFMAVLRAYGLSHHVTEESGSLVIWAPDEAHARMIVSAYERWQQGALELPELPAAPDTKLLPVKSLLQGFLGALWLAPVTVLLIIACLVVAVLSDMGANVIAVRLLFFPEVDLGASFPVAALFSGLDSAGDYLRTLTPALLHFGPVHLVFNTLWLWFFWPHDGAGTWHQGVSGSHDSDRIFCQCCAISLVRHVQFRWHVRCCLWTGRFCVDVAKFAAKYIAAPATADDHGISGGAGVDGSISFFNDCLSGSSGRFIVRYAVGINDGNDVYVVW